MRWTFAFWTPGHVPVSGENMFGCASHGFAKPDVWAGPDEAGLAAWPVPLEGEVVGGTYADVLEQLGRIAIQPRAAIVLFAQGSGMESFLEQWHACFPCVPVAGGAGARAAGDSHAEALPRAQDVAVLLISEGTWRAESLNVHNEMGPEIEIEPEGPRTIVRCKQSPDGSWQSAAGFFRACQAGFGRAKGDCESITLADAQGRNLHCSVAGERLLSGADLPRDGRLWLRMADRDRAAAGLQAFCSHPGALVFGCAGLRSLLGRPLAVGRDVVAGFMYGELVTLEGRPQFGNLMGCRLSRIGA